MVKNIAEIKKDAIATAAKEFNGWQGKAAVMLDLSDGEVWTDTFTGTSYKVYHSNTIIGVYCKDDFEQRDKRISPERLGRVIGQVLQADILNLDENDRYNALRDAVLDTLD